MADASLTGRLLVASPAIGDPNFERSVVFVLDHTDDGTLGVVVNRPTPVDVSEILPSWEVVATSPGKVFQGGPVALDSALGLGEVSGSEEPLGWRRVSGGVGLVDLDAPPEIVASELCAMRIFAGYAGWGAGQLEGELAQDAWFVVDAEPHDLFCTAPDQLWRTVLRRQSGNLAMLSTYPDDPSLN